jgi:predicted outer membrane repeat protein
MWMQHPRQNAATRPSTVAMWRSDPRWMLSLLAALALAVTAGLVVLAPTASADSGTVVVTTPLDDDGVTASCPSDDACTLRAAIAYAAGEPGVDTVVFAEGIDPVLGPDGSIAVAGEVTVRGNLAGAAPGTTIAGSDGFDDRILRIEGGAVVTLEHLIVTGGTLSGSGLNGGAIENLGDLTVRNSRFEGNTIAGSSAGGGAIGSSGTLEVRGSSFVGNTAGDAGTATSGGAISVGPNGSALVADSTFTDNSAGRLGGAIAVRNGDIEVAGSTFRGNEANSGGAISIGFDDTEPGTPSGLITGTNVDGNTATNVGGGIYVTGAEVTVTTTSIVDNQAAGGGGVASFASFETGEGVSTGTLTLDRSLLAGNRASSDRLGGGAIWFDTTVIDVTNSTISGNETDGFGGAIYGESVADLRNGITLTHTTVVGNVARGFEPAGGAIILGSAARATIDHSILVGNVGGTECVAVPGAVTSQGFNLVGDDSCEPVADDLVDVADALLGSLAANGGPTLTHLPSEGSPAIDGGRNPTCAVDVDQRGEPRPAPDSSACDIGAVEVQPAVDEAPDETPGATPDGDDDDADEQQAVVDEELPVAPPAAAITAEPDFTG